MLKTTAQKIFPKVNNHTQLNKFINLQIKEQYQE